MKRILSVELCLALAIVALTVSMATACKKVETPAPLPEPTAAPTIVVVEPPPTDQAICYVKVPAGTPPYCRNAAGVQVTCPANMTGLPTCAD